MTEEKVGLDSCWIGISISIMEKDKYSVEGVVDVIVCEDVVS